MEQLCWITMPRRMLALCLAFIVCTAEGFSEDLSLLPSGRSTTPSPTLSPTLGACAERVLNDGQCDTSCSDDCADCWTGTNGVKTSGPCDDQCPHHKKETNCNPQLWSEAWRANNRNGTCHSGVGHSNLQHPPGESNQDGSNSNIAFLNELLDPKSDGALLEISHLRTYFGLQCAAQKLSEICADIFEEFARSLSEYAKAHSISMTEAALHGKGTICNRRFPMWHSDQEDAQLCTTQNPCITKDITSGYVNTKNYQVAECWSHSNNKTGAHGPPWNSTKTFQGILDSCASTCMRDPKRGCCNVPKAIEWMFPRCQCQKQEPAKKGRRLQGAAIGATITVEATRQHKNRYNTLVTCLGDGKPMSSCLYQDPTTKPTTRPTSKATTKPPTTNAPSTKAPTAESPTRAPMGVPTGAPAQVPTMAATSTTKGLPTAGFLCVDVGPPPYMTWIVSCHDFQAQGYCTQDPDQAAKLCPVTCQAGCSKTQH